MSDTTGKAPQAIASNREREVFQMIAEGRSTKEISDILCISPSTVKTHRAKIMEKLKMENISQLIQFAIRIGIVDVQSWPRLYLSPWKIVLYVKKIIRWTIAIIWKVD